MLRLFTRLLLIPLTLALLLWDVAFSAESPWVRMPAGGRPTYMGIHGGTMPVSLLVSDDGTSLLTFVGRTGNDFLELLHRTDVQLPSILKKTAQNSTSDRLKTRAILQAGDKHTTMPVLVITDIGYLHKTLATQDFTPFGFSAKPLSIEGTVRFPQVSNRRRKSYRLFFQPKYLIPR